jgi:hypothetical protein
LSNTFLDKTTGKPYVALSDEDVRTALANPDRYQAVGPVNTITPSGREIAVTPEHAAALQGQGGRVQTGLESDLLAQGEAEAREYDSPLTAVALGAARTLSFGGTDWVANKLGMGEDVAKYKEHNPVGSLVGEAGSALLPVGAPGLIARAAKTASGTVRGTSAVSKIAAGVVEGAVDGGMFNAGQHVSQVALASDPEAVESLGASITSGLLWGGGVGGGLGAVAATSATIRKRMASKANPLLDARSAGAKEIGQHYGSALREVDNGVNGAYNAAVRKRADEIEAQLFNPSDDGVMGGAFVPPGVDPAEHWASVAKREAADRKLKQVVSEADAGAPKGGGDNASTGGFGNKKKRGKPRDYDAPPDQQRADPVPESAPVASAPRDTLVEGELFVPGPGRQRRAGDTTVDVLPEGRAAGALADDAERAAFTQVDELPLGAAVGAERRQAEQAARAAEQAARAEAKAAGAAAKVEGRAAAKAQREFDSADTLISGGPPDYLTRFNAREVPGESAFMFANRVAREELADIQPQLAAARKAVTDRLGKEMNLDLGALARKKPADAIRAAEAVDGYLKLVQDLRVRGGALDRADDVIFKQLEKASPESAKAFGNLQSMDRAGIADVLGVDVGKIPQLGPAAEHMLKAYSVARFADGFAAKAAVKAAEVRLPKAEMLKAGIGFGLRRAAGAAVGLAMAHPARVLMSLASRAGRVAAKVAEGVDEFVKVATSGGARRAVTRTGLAVFSQVRFAEQVGEGKTDAIRRIRELQQTMSNPGALESFLDDHLAPIRAHNMDLGYQLADHLKARYSFLASKMPFLPQPDPFTGWQPEPSEADLSDWGRYVEAAENPLLILDELYSGHLAPETVETVKELYPGLFEAVRQKIIERVIDARTPVQYQDRLNLGQLFDLPLEPTAAPEVVAGLQEMYAMQAEEQQASQPRGTPKPPSPTKGQQFAA